MPFPVLDACFALFAGEKMAPDEVRAALRAMFPEHEPTTARRVGARSSCASSRSRSTSGCRRRSRCTSATWTSIASARCSCRSCSAPSGSGSERFLINREINEIREAINGKIKRSKRARPNTVSDLTF